MIVDAALAVVSTITVGAAIGVACLLLIAAIAKAFDPGPLRRFLVTVAPGLDRWTSHQQRAAVLVVIAVEVAVAAAVFRAPASRHAAGLLASLAFVFVVAAVMGARAGQRCGCLGSLGRGSRAGIVVRLGLVVSTAAIATVAAWSGIEPMSHPVVVGAVASIVLAVALLADLDPDTLRRRTLPTTTERRPWARWRTVRRVRRSIVSGVDPGVIDVESLHWWAAAVRRCDPVGFAAGRHDGTTHLVSVPGANRALTAVIPPTGAMSIAMVDGDERVSATARLRVDRVGRGRVGRQVPRTSHARLPVRASPSSTGCRTIDRSPTNAATP